MLLSDTVKLMESPDFKDRMRAEYYQTKIRYDKLHDMINRYDAGKLDFVPNCQLELLKEQAYHMENYLRVLEVRALIEEVDF